MTTAEDGYRLAGEIATDIYESHLWPKSRFRYGNPAAEYELIGSDEGEELGIAPAEDPYWTGLRRKSDGQLFEVVARPVESPAPKAEIEGQQDLLEATS